MKRLGRVLLGSMGSGKSYYMQNMASDIIKAGRAIRRKSEGYNNSASCHEYSKEEIPPNNTSLYTRQGKIRRTVEVSRPRTRSR